MLLERRLLFCSMTVAVGRYSAPPASLQQSIISLSADVHTPLILLHPLPLSETFKTFPCSLALPLPEMYAHIKTLHNFSHKLRKTNKAVGVKWCKKQNKTKKKRVTKVNVCFNLMVYIEVTVGPCGKAMQLVRC